ncbi:hypothetical protein ABN254_21625, partial [Providencia rettgeri]
ATHVFRQGPQAVDRSSYTPRQSTNRHPTSTTTMPRRNPTGEGEGPSNIQYSIIDGKALDPLHFSP